MLINTWNLCIWTANCNKFSLYGLCSSKISAIIVVVVIIIIIIIIVIHLNSIASKFGWQPMKRTKKNRQESKSPLKAKHKVERIF